MKVVFLHGIGDGDPDRRWLEGLNRALVDAGHPAVAESQLVTPRYSSYLKTDGVSAKMPDVTYRPKDDTQSRREFERRQAAVNRSLQHDPSVAAFGFHMLPRPFMTAAQQFGVQDVPVMNLDQVRRYVENEGLRGAILQYILEQLPRTGDIILVGHSLGSVIAIDLLDHLPEKLRVRRFITLGSPANSQALHRGSERLLKKFPYSRVDDWVNVFSHHDIATMGRGLASVFPGAQDFAINIPGMLEHAAERYLAHPAVSKLVAEILYPSKQVVQAGSDIVVRLTDEQYFTLIKLRFAWAVSKKIKDTERAKRYTDALRVIQDDLAAQLKQLADAGHALAPELHSVIAGNLPALPNRLELREAVIILTDLTAVNLIEPYEIETDDAPRAALSSIAINLGLRPDISKQIVIALTEVNELLKRSGGIPWGRIGFAAAGLALLAAGPVGLMVAAPASAFGAAAITGGLAAFGPGGMVGGLATLGALAASGASVAAGAAFVDTGPESLVLNVTQLSLRVAADYALKLLDLPTDSELWGRLARLETQIAAESNRLEAFSDAKADQLLRLKAAREAVVKLLGFVVDKRLGGAVGIVAGVAH